MDRSFNMTYALDEVSYVVDELLECLKEHSVMTLTGPLGVGKTTLVQKILRRCGVTESVTSPTFTYMQQYSTPDGLIIYHFDLYRLGSSHEFEELGLHEYLYIPNSYAIIEWPAVARPFLSQRVCHATLHYVNLERRMIEVQCVD